MTIKDNRFVYNFPDLSKCDSTEPVDFTLPIGNALERYGIPGSSEIAFSRKDLIGENRILICNIDDTFRLIEPAYDGDVLLLNPIGSGDRYKIRYPRDFDKQDIRLIGRVIGYYPEQGCL